MVAQGSLGALGKQEVRVGNDGHGVHGEGAEGAHTTQVANHQ